MYANKNKPENNVFYASFGGGQTFPNKSVKLIAKNETDARAAMFATFGKNFCTTYDHTFVDSQFFQPPVMEITCLYYGEHCDPEFTCTRLYPENLL